MNWVQKQSKGHKNQENCPRKYCKCGDTPIECQSNKKRHKKIGRDIPKSREKS